MLEFVHLIQIVHLVYESASLWQATILACPSQYGCPLIRRMAVLEGAFDSRRAWDCLKRPQDCEGNGSICSQGSLGSLIRAPPRRGGGHDFGEWNPIFESHKVVETQMPGIWNKWCSSWKSTAGNSTVIGSDGKLENDTFSMWPFVTWIVDRLLPYLSFFNAFQCFFISTFFVFFFSCHLLSLFCLWQVRMCAHCGGKGGLDNPITSRVQKRLRWKAFR